MAVSGDCKVNINGRRGGGNRKVFARLCALLTFFLANSVAFGVQALEGWSRSSDNEIRLDGVIGPDSLAKFQSAAEGGFTRVVLNSPGGMEFVAMRIAQDPRYKDADIVVSEKCISSCANYLAVLGRSLSVDCNSVIGFHGTTLPRYRFLPGYGWSFLAKVNNKYRGRLVENWYENSENEALSLFKSIMSQRVV